MYLSLSKIFIYILIFFIFFSNFNSYSSNQKLLYSRKSISGYFSGIISSNNNNNKLALKYFNSLDHLKNNHDEFNRKQVLSMVQTQKIPELFEYLKRLRKENLNFFNANLLLGINYLLEKNYKKSVNYFNLIIYNRKFSGFEKLIAQSLLNYTRVFESGSYDYQRALNIIPEGYKSFGLINDAFANCFLDNRNVEESFLRIINPDTLNFSRYNFFYINYLVSKNRKSEALKIIEKNYDIFETNLLLKQIRTWLREGKENKIKTIFNCRNPKHIIGELFYLIANLHSNEANYVFSNFYLNLSIYLNPKFIFNNALLAENYYHLEDYENSIKTFSKFDSKNQIYSWYAKKRLVWIKNKIEDKESAINFLNKSFEELKNPTVKDYLDLANFYKDFEKYEDSIKFYTKVLNIIGSDHSLYSKVLHRRGMSYERLNLWEKSENDLVQSLSLVPEEPYVLNYLAYSWLERNINLEKSIEMLKMAFKKRKEDPYIIDSLGWGMYLTGKYEEAEKLLQKAVQLMPLDPIVNDHYADILWKLNKNLQANYFWNYVLNLETTEDEMKHRIKEKLIFGIENRS